MALYKEVQSYYDKGLEIPEDITLLFADDNFGSIRRLPNGEERKRSGGAGVSYLLDNVLHMSTLAHLLTTASFTTTSNTLESHGATAG
jgi:hypothetical protein